MKMTLKSLFTLAALTSMGHASLLEARGRCGPQTKVFMPADEAATAFLEKTFEAGKCMSIGRYDVHKVKICGPGTFSFSAMTCNRHDYKAHVIEVSKSENSGACTEVGLGDLPTGYMGSYTVTC